MWGGGGARNQVYHTILATTLEGGEETGSEGVVQSAEVPENLSVLFLDSQRNDPVDWPWNTGFPATLAATSDVEPRSPIQPADGPHQGSWLLLLCFPRPLQTSPAQGFIENRSQRKTGRAGGRGSVSVQAV